MKKKRGKKAVRVTGSFSCVPLHCYCPIKVKNKQRRRHMRFPAIHQPFAYKQNDYLEVKNTSFIKSICNIKTSWAKPDFKSAWCYLQSLISAVRGWRRLVGSVQRGRESKRHALLWNWCGLDELWVKRKMLKKEQLASSGVAVPRWRGKVMPLVGNDLFSS